MKNDINIEVRTFGGGILDGGSYLTEHKHKTVLKTTSTEAIYIRYESITYPQKDEGYGINDITFTSNEETKVVSINRNGDDAPRETYTGGQVVLETYKKDSISIIA